MGELEVIRHQRQILRPGPVLIVTQLDSFDVFPPLEMRWKIILRSRRRIRHGRKVLRNDVWVLQFS